MRVRTRRPHPQPAVLLQLRPSVRRPDHRHRRNPPPHQLSLIAPRNYRNHWDLIRVSRPLDADCPHQLFNGGNDAFTTAKLTFRALSTPGRSPDSISVVLSRAGRDVTVFTDDMLFIGNVGRPDLRESTGYLTTRHETLAHQLLLAAHAVAVTGRQPAGVPHPRHGQNCGKTLAGTWTCSALRDKLSR